MKSEVRILDLEVVALFFFVVALLKASEVFPFLVTLMILEM